MKLLAICLICLIYLIMIVFIFVINIKDQKRRKDIIKNIRKRKRVIKL